MALNELELFMAAIRRLESNTYEGDYAARGPTVESGMYAGQKALGAYQIMPGNWAAWAAEAGIPGASWQSKAAQDAVARFKFTQYYQRFGDWRLVAIAWFAGPARAERARAEGIDSLSGVRDVIGTSVPTYVQKIVDYMHEAQDLGYGPSRDPEVVGRLDPQAQRSITSGQLSVDQPLFGAGEMGQGSQLYEPSVPSANPDLDPLDDYTGQVREPRRMGNQLDRDLLASDMHKKMSAVLQGLSNAIKAGAAAFGTSAPISAEERQLLETNDELAEVE